MAVSPPLDIIPGLPAKGVAELNKLSSKLIKQIAGKVGETLQDAIQLPDNIKCDDPRIEDIKQKIQEAQELIANLQDVIATIQKVATAVQQAAAIAAAIKSSIFLLPPPIGTAALQAELVEVQNMTIANAIEAVKQLNIIPESLNAGMGLINSQLANIIGQLGSICNNESFAVSDEVAANLDQQGDGNTIGGGEYNNPDGIGWGTAESRVDDATLGTEFYTDINVSKDDLQQYVSAAEKLVLNQQNLLTSIKEAPAQSYNGTTPPLRVLGKPGDYYIDTAAKKMYGPKTSDGWPSPVNY